MKTKTKPQDLPADFVPAPVPAVVPAPATGVRLYVVAQELESLLRDLEVYAIEHDGDITDFPMQAQLDALQMTFEQKVENCACVVKSLEAEEKAIAAEVKALNARKKSVEGRRAKLEVYIEQNLPKDACIRSARAEVSWRAAGLGKVELLVKAEELPPRFQRVAVTPDLAGLSEALRAGEEVPGAALVKKPSLQIK